MNVRRIPSVRWSLALGAWLLAGVAQAQPVYRCGNSYGSAPCPGGQAVDVDDTRSDAQRLQAAAVRQQDQALARTLAAERRAREQAPTARLAAAGIGPTAAERLRLDAAAKARKPARADEHRAKRRTRLTVASIAQS